MFKIMTLGVYGQSQRYRHSGKANEGGGVSKGRRLAKHKKEIERQRPKQREGWRQRKKEGNKTKSKCSKVHVSKEEGELKAKFESVSEIVSGTRIRNKFGVTHERKKKKVVTEKRTA